MSSVDLENLDNKTLRAKCLEYGLPNVPITDTSRKILIRKLRAAMDGTTNEKTKSTRRETIHVTQTVNATKNSTPKKETPKKIITNNRRTIASVREDELVHTPIVPKQVTQRRQSNRGTPTIPQERLIPVNVERRQAQPPIIEEHNSDDDFILIDDDTPEMYSQLPPRAVTPYRKSRSPSLGKSATITTSYKKETLLQKNAIPEDESESDNDTPLSPIGRKKIDNYEITNSFVPNRPIEPPTIPRYSQPSTYLQRPSIEKEQYPVGYKPIYPTLNPVVPEISKYSYDNQATTRRYTTSGLTQPKVSTYTPSTVATKRFSTPQQYAENSDTNGEDDDAGQEGDTPYLSDFAKRLSRLKAEPLDIGYKKDLSELREHRYGNSPTGIRRSTYSARRNANTVGESFKEFWFALDYKYKIMKKLIILLLISIILLSIYIYSNYFN